MTWTLLGTFPDAALKVVSGPICCICAKSCTKPAVWSLCNCTKVKEEHFTRTASNFSSYLQQKQRAVPHLSGSKWKIKTKQTVRESGSYWVPALPCGSLGCPGALPCLRWCSWWTGCAPPHQFIGVSTTEIKHTSDTCWITVALSCAGL